MFQLFLKNFGNFIAVDKIRCRFTFPLLFLFVLFSSCGIYFIFKCVPQDEVQGIFSKIMYLHVPAAWACSIIYLIMTILSLLFLLYKNPFFALTSYSLSISGTFFNIICIITGMIWGKQTWGVYWAWDARLTSVVILLLLYVFYIAVINSDNHSTSSLRIASISNLIGAINLPIIKFSVELWNGVHQPASIIRNGGISIAAIMFYPLLIFFFAFACFTIAITILELHNLLLQKKIRHLEMKRIIC